VAERETSDNHWKPGETIALRYITRDNLPGMAWPATVVQDNHDLTAIFIPAGATYKRWRVPPAASGAARQLEDALWRRDTLRLMYPGRQHSIWLSWTGEGNVRGLHSYYINMEEPFRRSSIGLDTNDHTLDVVVRPDLTWEWKDEQEFATRTERGVFGSEFASSVRAEGEAVIARLEARKPPFCDGWEGWAPDPLWETPELPDGWDTVAATLWERRVWAYGEMAR
jgi:hypothetical protein